MADEITSRYNQSTASTTPTCHRRITGESTHTSGIELTRSATYPGAVAKLQDPIASNLKACDKKTRTSKTKYDNNRQMNNHLRTPSIPAYCSSNPSLRLYRKTTITISMNPLSSLAKTNIGTSSTTNSDPTLLPKNGYQLLTIHMALAILVLTMTSTSKSTINSRVYATKAPL